jgi:asparagine synthase (glutamine-hydrolysing)
MCGISGLVYFDPTRVVDTEIVRAMCRTLRHRGPDDLGLAVRGHVALGMTRLSIVDLATGRQPIANEDESVWLVCNGEIYNQAELRAELTARGHRFRSRSDVEVVVHAYEESGPACIERLNGMFALALWDERRHRLLLARDRLGKKPLYYAADGERLLFASELRALLAFPGLDRAVDLEALDAYLTLEYVPAPASILKSVKKLPAAHRLLLEGARPLVERYWQLRLEPTEAAAPRPGERLLELVEDAVRIRLMSDVPLGVLLSGGVDSSTVVATMARRPATPVKTFSVGFADGTYNELSYARLVAERFGTEHHETILDGTLAPLVEPVLRHLDEPLADFSVLPTYLVSRFAREHVTVALSGDGGDELFAGYDTYVAQRLARLYGALPAAVRRRLIPAAVRRLRPSPKKKGAINRVLRFVEGAALPEELEHTRWMIAFSEAEKTTLYDEAVQAELPVGAGVRHLARHFAAAPSADALARQQWVDVHSYLTDDILVKVDRMSMANSLEVRCPLLDYRLAEFALNLPARLKLRGLSGKRLLRQAMAPVLPAEILTRGKEGFSMPIKHWLRGEIRELMLDLLSEERLRKRGLFAPFHVRRLVDEHLADRANHSHRLWALMAFELWCDEYLDRGRPR